MQAETNGVAQVAHYTEQQLANVLTDSPMTTGYVPTLPVSHFWHEDGSVAYWQCLRDVEPMLAYDRVKICLDYYKAGIHMAEFKATSSKPQVGKFGLEQLKRLWTVCLNKIQGSYDFGWAGFEPCYEEFNSLLQFDNLVDFHPNDVRVLTRGHEYRGVRVRGIRGIQGVQGPQLLGGKVDLWGPMHGPSKGFWYAHNRRYDRWHGRTQLYAAWRPWSRLARKDGAEESLDTAMYRVGHGIVIVRHPPGDYKDPATGRMKPYRDDARLVGENIKANAAVAMSSARDPNSKELLWDIAMPENTLDPHGTLDYCDHLENKICMGIGVPPEILEASETGSGYSGRMIPLEAYFVSQQPNANEILLALKEQIIDPLIKWNFGPDAWWRVECVPLLETRRKTMGGDPNSSGGGAPGQPPPGGQEGSRGQPENGKGGGVPQLPAPGQGGPGHTFSLDLRGDIVQTGEPERRWFSAGWDAGKHPRGQPGNTGQFAKHREATEAMKAAHPFPGPAPDLPPGVFSKEPRFLNDPKIQEAAKRHDKHAGEYHRAFISQAVHDLLHGKPRKPLPSPDPSLPEKRQGRLLLKASEREAEAYHLVMALGPAFAPHAKAAAAVHAGGPAALEEARQEAGRRHQEAVKQLEGHARAVAALGPDMAKYLRLARQQAATVRFAFDPAQHPRGQPQNKGEFVKGQGKGADSPAPDLFTGLDKPATESAKEAPAAPKPGARAAALAKQMAALKQARIDTFNAVKADAVAAMGQVEALSSDMIQQHMDNIGWDPANEAHQPFTDLEAHLHDLRDADTVAGRAEALRNVRDAAKEALKVDVAKTSDDPEFADYVKSNRENVKSILEGSKAARQQLQAYVQHVREMHAIRSGESMEVQMAMVLPEEGTTWFAHDVSTEARVPKGATFAADVEWVRAPKGGAVSPVNQQRYEGGEFMPIHGKSEKKPGEKGKKKPIRKSKSMDRFGKYVEVPEGHIGIDVLVHGHPVKSKTLDGGALKYIGLSKEQVADLADIWEANDGSAYVPREIVPPSALATTSSIDPSWSIKEKWQEHQKAKGEARRKEDADRLQKILAEEKERSNASEAGRQEHRSEHPGASPVGPPAAASGGHSPEDGGPEQAAGQAEVLPEEVSRPQTYWKGDRAEYTGITEDIDGTTMHEVEIMEGRLKGQTKLTSKGPDGHDPNVERSRKAHQEMQEGFKRLRESGKSDQSPPARKAAPEASQSPHVAALQSLPTNGIVGGWFVHKLGDGKFQVQTDRAHVTGDAATISAFLDRQWKDQRPDQKRIDAALQRAAATSEPAWHTEAAREADRAWQALPKGTRVVVTEGERRGRIGEIVKVQEDGKPVNKVKLDNEPGYHALPAEPLHPKHSWRVKGEGKTAEPKPVQQSFFAAKTEKGHWITIGGKPGPDGKKHHGGSPVYIENGRITKGHPGLLGKKIGALSEAAEEHSHRKELQQGKQYSRAVWAKKAKAEGIHPQHLHQLAAEILAHDRAFKGEMTSMLKQARKALDEFGGAHRMIAARQQRGGKGQLEEGDQIKGMDEVAEWASQHYPSIVGDDPVDAEQRLFDLLQAGNPEAMTEEDAYQQAHEHLKEHRPEVTPTHGLEVSDVPFTDQFSLAGSSFNLPEDDAADQLVTLLASAGDALAAEILAGLVSTLDLPSAERLDAARAVLVRFEPRIAALFTDLQVNALLAGMRRVVDRLPPAILPGPAAALPSALSPTEQAIWRPAVAYAKQLEPDLLDAWLRGLAPPVQAFLVSQLPPVPPAPWGIAAPGEPSGVRLPLIENAIENLRTRRLMTRDAFDDLRADARRTAFAVAGVECLKTLAKVQAALAETVAGGLDYREFAKRVEPGTFLSPAHRENVFRTGAQIALADGEEKILNHPLVSDAFPFVKAAPIHDDRTEPVCSQMTTCGIEGTAWFLRSDLTYQRYRRPRHWQCRCGDFAGSIEDAAHDGLAYAQKWLETGQQPLPLPYVAEPAVSLPDGWDAGKPGVMEPALLSLVRSPDT